MSEETLCSELLYAGELGRKRRGEVAELAFMRKAATLGFGVAKPWGDCGRYDVIVRAGKVFWRVQIKSVWGLTPTRTDYRVKTSGNRFSLYSPDEIDFLVAYIFPKDLWYVFPVALVEHRKAVCLSPGSKRSKYEHYREAWKLMGPTNTEQSSPRPPPDDSPPAPELRPP
jgi:Protein of unknown function (DUF3257).